MECKAPESVRPTRLSRSCMRDLPEADLRDRPEARPREPEDCPKICRRARANNARSRSGSDGFPYGLPRWYMLTKPVSWTQAEVKVRAPSLPFSICRSAITPGNPELRPSRVAGVRQTLPGSGKSDSRGSWGSVNVTPGRGSLTPAGRGGPSMSPRVGAV